MDVIYTVSYKTITDETGVILSRRDNGEYVVHSYYGEPGAHHEGDYFDNLKEAKQRFYLRSQALIRRLTA